MDPKRRLIIGAGAATSLATVSAHSAAPAAPSPAGPSAPAVHRGLVQLDMVTGWPRSMTAMHGAAERFARRVEQFTSGQVTVRVHAAGEKVGALETLNALQAGAAQLSHGTAYYWTNRSPAFAFFATVPFGMTAGEHSAWLREGGGQELWDQLGESHGVKPFACGNTGVQAGGWFREPIRTREDLSGKRIRFPGIGGQLFARLGATPVLAAATEIKPMLERGELDAAEWIAPWPDLEFGLYEYCKYCYYPGVHEPSHTIELNVAIDTWRTLSPTMQHAIKAAALTEEAAMPAEFLARNSLAVIELIEKHEVQFLRFPNDVIRALRVHADEVVDEFVGSDAVTEVVRRSYFDFARRIARYSEFADRAYWQARFT